MSSRSILGLFFTFAIACGGAETQPAPDPASDPRSSVTPGSDDDDAIRALQTVGELPAHGDAIRIASARIEGTTLLVEVEHGGGCAEHEYALYWNGACGESYPLSCGVRLVHDAHGDMCRAMLSRKLRFDVSAIGGGSPYRLGVEGPSNTASASSGTASSSSSPPPVQADPGSTSATDAVRPLRTVRALPAHGDAIRIDRARIEGTTLIVDVAHGGGCAQHDYTLYWSGSCGESLPQSCSVRLVHDGHGDTCEAMLSRSLRFDVSAIGGGSPYRLGVEGPSNSTSTSSDT